MMRAPIACEGSLAVFRAGKRAVVLGFDLGLVMGSSEVWATPSVALPEPRPGEAPRRGKIPKRALAASSRHSNAPIKPESQSILSKIVAGSAAAPPHLHPSKAPSRALSRSAPRLKSKISELTLNSAITPAGTLLERPQMRPLR
jgi:hypothetical protein